jgi:hypothetical protein
MDIEFLDFNGSDALFGKRFAAEWQEVAAALESIQPHLKESDQANIQGNLIFDPVGTNWAIKDKLEKCGWHPNVTMHSDFSFLGTDVDFVKSGVLVEVQFSNYPFLLNNTVRAELLFKSRLPMAKAPIDALVVITKAHMFPASNSTLYYEQAVKQLTELARHRVLDIPIRLVGLFTRRGLIDATFTGYHTARYSRTVVDRSSRKCRVSAGPTGRSRTKISFA